MAASVVKIAHPRLEKAFALPVYLLTPLVAMMLEMLVTPGGDPILTDAGKAWLSSFLGGLFKKKPLPPAV